VKVLENLGLSDEIPIAALAKSFEEVFRPGDPEPVRIPRGSDALFLLQRVRDEAHRFAITYHRSLRGKRMTRSILDGIPGLGPARRTRLIREMGSIAAVRRASLEELLELKWLPDSTARAVYRQLHQLTEPRPARTPLPIPSARTRSIRETSESSERNSPDSDSPDSGTPDSGSSGDSGFPGKPPAEGIADTMHATEAAR
jgi:hypothetical protein